jgi:aminocarboxymuconate-semialdehyde decarboxylase
VSDRREILKRCATAATGIFFVGCGFVESSLRAFQSRGVRRRREVVVGGRRIRTVDVHSHVYVTEAWDLVKVHVGGENEATSRPVLNPVNAADRMAQMDEYGIDVQVVGINPNWYWAERDLAQKIIKIQNEKVADLCVAHPERFAGLCSVALQHPDLAAEQLEEGLKKFGMRGALVGAMVNNDELSAQKFNPFWAKAEELGAVIFIHPMGPLELPEGQGRFKGPQNLVSLVGNPLGTTLALSHLIFDGTLDRFPGLKICSAHGGGFLPSYIGRSDRCVDNGGCKTIKKHPSEYLKRMYFDSLVFTNEGLRHLIAEVGINQIVLGTDFPYGWQHDAVDYVLRVPGLSDEDRRAILGGNAAKLLRIGS